MALEIAGLTPCHGLSSHKARVGGKLVSTMALSTGLVGAMIHGISPGSVVTSRLTAIRARHSMSLPIIDLD